ncbi:hypothetical protein [Sandaracinus amylolyticus]|uniref:Uncharacterized protein n=1 Tax=Sandaracinus amylolyticus TaxID=927083 RepID=A0A0F6YKC6_9BACT|nr:hypothetical protein [Sandaracinus amylolyticus]AKF08185.1 hypothetical protein DB32_005334 [Sandaracinus amylolyticus]
MSEGAVYREALAWIVALELEPATERDLVRCLDAARTGPLGFVYAACVESGVDAARARARAAGAFFSFAAGNLADDLADGDCTYLEPAHRVGPCAQFALQNAAWSTWSGAGDVDRETLRAIGRDLVRAASLQHVEVRTQRFDLVTTQRIAEAMGGLQYGAYLRAAWCGTELAEHAAEVGTALGTAGFVAEDLRSDDPRVTTLPDDDRRALARWADALLDRARAIDLPSLAGACAPITARLRSVS